MTDETLLNDHLIRCMRDEGVPQHHINFVMNARARLVAEDNQRGSQVMNVDVSQISASIKELGTNVQAYRDNTDQRVSEVLARVQSLEQSVAMGSNREGGGMAEQSVGEHAVATFKDDPSFQAAADTAARGMKPSQFSTRINLDSSIRAALTNKGRGGQADTAYPTPTDRRGAVAPVQPSLRLLDVLPSRPTSSDTVEFIQLGVTGDAAEQVNEGDIKAEIDIDGTPQTASVATIAGWTSASKQVLADNASLGQQIDNLIRNKLLSRLENQLINGPGGQGKILGLLLQSTAFVPTIGSTSADIIGESLVTMANAGYLPGLVLMNPLDWFKIQTTRKNTTDDEYVFGSPTVPVPKALWNTSIVTTPSIAQGTALTVDTSFTTVLDREQVSVDVSNSHADYFVRNLIAILGELRAGLEVLDTKAVRKFSLAA